MSLGKKKNCQREHGIVREITRACHRIKLQKKKTTHQETKKGRQKAKLPEAENTVRIFKGKRGRNQEGKQ